MGRQRKRSVPGGGSVFLRKDGRWEARFKVEETGKYKSLYAKTERDAYKLLEDAKFQQRQGALATGPQQTVGQFLAYWLEDVQKPAVRLSTYRINRIIVQRHLIPGLGHIKLQKLTTQHVQTFYAKKLREGMAASRVRQLHGMLHKALTYARRIKLVGSNVAEDVELPKARKPKHVALTPEQALLLLEKAREKKLDVLIALAVSTGMREGEILALRWSDIDLAKGTIQVSRTVNYLPKFHFVEGEPKTESSKRTIQISRFLVDLLRKHRALQLEKRLEKKLKAGDRWVDRDLVFPNSVGGFLLGNVLRNQFYRLLADAGLPRMHFHDLRHSAATILISMGVPPNVVQKLLGHSDIAITLGVYGAVLPSMQQDVADKMDDLFGSNP
ncbi:MAG TPA: tyrosine-type recombinase/integrase [Ktedonobacteraceae bacterium]|nr:tyrosine-type recombinase/integrase [Ktedonobacteraceae bacterium]